MNGLKFCLAFCLCAILSFSASAQKDTLVFKNGVTWLGVTTAFYGNSIDFVRTGESSYRADISKIQMLRGPNAARIMSKEAYAFLAGQSNQGVIQGDEFINNGTNSEGLDGVFVRGRRAYNADYTLRGRVSYKDWMARNNSISINSGFSHALGAFSDLPRDFMSEQGSGASFGWLVSVNFESKLTNSLALRGMISSGNNGLSLGINSGVQQNKTGWLDFSGFNLGLAYQKDLFAWIQSSFYAMGGYGHYKYIITSESTPGNEAARNIESGAHAFQYVLGSELRIQYSKRRADYLKAGVQVIGSQPTYNLDFRSSNTPEPPKRSVTLAKPYTAIQFELGLGTYF